MKVIKSSLFVTLGFILVIFAILSHSTVVAESTHEENPSKVPLIIPIDENEKQGPPSWISFTSDETPRAPDIEVLYSNETSCILNITIYGMYVEEIEKSGNYFDRLTLPGQGYLFDIGKPEIPAVRGFIETPSGKNVTITVLSSEQFEVSGYTVYPNQEPVIDSDYRMSGDDFQFNEMFYLSDSYYPDRLVSISSLSQMRDHTIVQLSVYPIMFNPVAKQLLVSVRMTVKMDFTEVTNSMKSKVDAISSDRLSSSSFDEISESIVLNNYVSSDVQENALSEPTDGYLIITHDNFYSQMSTFADWKAANGFSVTLVKLSDISSDATDEDIYNFISYAYYSWATPPTYVLLVGDVEYLPTHYSDYSEGAPDWGSEEYKAVATDNYYSLVSGDDYFPDLHIGRLSVKDNSELNNIISKFMGYKGFFNQKATLVSQKPQEGHTFEKTADELFDVLSIQGYTVDKLYETLGTATAVHITNALNDGRSIINYYSHGAPEGWYWDAGKFDNEDVKSLENIGKYPVVISIACSTGKYDYFSDSFGETLMKAPEKGAIAFIGSTRLAPSWHSRDLGKGIYEAIFNERLTEFGPITTSAKIHLFHMWGINYYSILVCDLFNILTDPQLDLSPFPDHELIVELDVPNVFLSQTSTILNVTVSNLSLNYESNVEIKLFINDEITMQYVISELAGSSSFNLSYPWTPMGGIYNVTVFVQPVSGEEYLWNNLISRTVYVIPSSEILVVDDNDGESADIGTSLFEFKSILEDAGYDYWVWNETSLGNPPVWFVTYFDLVVWTCGDYYHEAVDPTDALTLESYLNLGGNLLLEGGEIGFDHSADVFMTRVAHAEYQTDSTGAPGLTISNFDHAVTNGLPLHIPWTSAPSNDGVTPSNLGTEVIRYSGTNWSAVTVFEGDDSKVVYCSFPLYALENSTREQLIENSIRWLLEPPETLGWIMDISLNSTSSSHERNPSIATDSDGKLYVAYEQYNNDSGLYEIKVSESVDDGITWTRIGGVYDSFNLGHPSIAIDLGDSDNIFVVFEREHSATDHDLFVLKNVNGSWSVSAVASDDDDYRYPSITSEYQWGTYDYQYISYEHVNTNDDRDLMFAKSTDDGNTWITSKLHGGFLDWNVHTQSSIATARGSDGRDYIYIVYKWGAGYDSAYDIVLDRSSDYGNTWTQHWVLDESSRDKNWPVIAATRGGGTAVIAWHVYYDLDYLNDIQYAWSTDNGDSWDTGWLATEAYVNEKTPILTVDGQDSTSNSTYGRIHIAYWRDNDIYYRSTTFNSPWFWTQAEAVPDLETYVSGVHTKPAATTYRDLNGRYQPAVVWTSYRNSTYYVCYSTKNVTTLTVEPLTISLNSLKGWEGGKLTATGNGAAANASVYLSILGCDC